MRYQQPYGIADPNAPYINGDPSIGRRGSIPPAAAFEQPMREIVNMISLSGGTPSDADLQQLAKAVQSSRINYAVDVGTQNHMVAVLTPPWPASTPYPPGLIVRVKALHGNLDDGSHTTFDFDAGGGPFSVVRPDGSYPLTNDIPAGSIVQLVSDGTRWQIESGALGTAGGGTSTVLVKIPYAADTSVVPNTITVAFSPAITAPAVGDVILIKVNNTVTGPTVINVNAIAVKNLVKNDGTVSALAPMDAVRYGLYLCEWDGTEWVLLNPAFGLLSLPTAPLFPETVTNNGFFQFSTSTGSVVIQDTSVWQWRGLRRYTTAMFTAPNRTLATTAAKIYHLRWDAPGTGLAVPGDTYPNGRFVLRDLADAAYNPTAAQEQAQMFDTTYDSMLIALVFTDGSNNPTVTPLLNKQYMSSSITKNTQNETFSSPGDLAWKPVVSVTLNWSRMPRMSLLWSNIISTPSGSPYYGIGGFDMINGTGSITGHSSGAWINRYSVGRRGAVLANTGSSWLDLPFIARIEA